MTADGATTPPGPADREEVIAIATEAATAAVADTAAAVLKKAYAECGAGKAGKTVGDVLDGMLTEWNKPLKTPLSDRERQFFAFSGALPWVIYNLTPPEWRSYVQSLEDTLLAAGILLGGVAIQALLAGWFSWLIAYRERRSSPTRLFLEGFMLPGLAAALLTGVSILEGLARGAP